MRTPGNRLSLGLGVAVVLGSMLLGPVHGLEPRGAGGAAQADSAFTAQEIVAEATSRARAEHKQVLIIFSASWCGPCHLLERFLQDPAIRPIMDRAFVTARLDVGERPRDARHADTPGAVALEASMGGKDAGYPYLVIANAGGRPVVSSVRPGQGRDEGGNIGYPASPAEINWFVHMLQQAAPGISAQELATVRTWLQTHG